MRWTKENNQLICQFTFADFIQAWSFMTEVAMTAEKMNHHPTWTNTYNQVEIRLCTHDAGNIITQKDEELAEAIDQMYRRFS